MARPDGFVLAEKERGPAGSFPADLEFLGRQDEPWDGLI